MGVYNSLWWLPALVWPALVFADVDPIVIKGSHFFYKTNGSEFPIKGIGYRHVFNDTGSSFIDLLAGSDCKRDIPYLTRLQTNMIVVDGIKPDQDHSECMNAFADAGIYVIASLAPAYVLKQTEPRAAWDTSAYNFTTNVIDTMVKFTNLLGFITPTINAFYGSTPEYPFSKAMVRDAKAYMKSHNLRDIPVGVLADTNLDGTYVDDLRDFLGCDEVHGDFLGLQPSQRVECPNETWIDDNIKRFADSSMPVFLASQGCQSSLNADDPANFPQDKIYSGDGRKTFSGMMFYEYFDTGRSRGLTENVSNPNQLIEGEVFQALSSVMATLSISTMDSKQYTVPPTKTTSCPAVHSSWTAAGPTLPPSPNEKVCSCMMSTLDCVASPNKFEAIGAGQSYKEWYELVCGRTDGRQDLCKGTAAEPSAGSYGAFSACEISQRLSWDMTYYDKTNSYSNQTCVADNFYNENFGNLSFNVYRDAFTKSTPTPMASINAECRFLLAQAGTDGTGTITQFDMKASATPGKPAGGSNPGNGNGNSAVGNSGLSVGAKAGVGVGVALAAIAILLLALFLLRRRKKARQVPQEEEEVFQKPELDGTGYVAKEKNPHEHGGELGGEGLAELPVGYHPVEAMNETPWELPAEEKRVEMPDKEPSEMMGSVGVQKGTGTGVVGSGNSASRGIGVVPAV